jgi:hypothetical protein
MKLTYTFTALVATIPMAVPAPEAESDAEVL